MTLAASKQQRISQWICSSCLSLKKPRTPSVRRTFATSTSPPHTRKKLPEAPARTRFAPSPTGYLHLGSLRTALYNYLLAKATGGQFLLRIEDTDQSRTVPDALGRICRDLQWAGLQWDEGPEVGGPYGPYIQSERTPVYHEHADKLLESGHAYRCFCSAERLQELAQMRNKLGLPTDYDRTCAGIAKEESDDKAARGERYTIRLKVPDTYPAFEDIIYGQIGRPKRNARKVTLGEQVFEDPILLKSDGRPTYHLANVVDDHLMKISHVIRAVEWMPSTPKHVYLYDAFGWTPPVFAHVGLLQGPDNQKLSKRTGDISIGHYRDKGVFPEALVNFVALLGWHHKQHTDIMDLKQMIDLFNLNFTKGNTVVNFPKLDYLSKEYAKEYIKDEGPEFQRILQASITALKQDGITTAPRGQDFDGYVRSILRADPTSCLDPALFGDRHRSFFELVQDNKDTTRNPLADAELVAEAYQSLCKLGEQQWNAELLNAALHEAIATRFDKTISQKDIKQTFSKLMSDLRQILLASGNGPGMGKSMEILGRVETLDRLEKAGPYPRSTAMI